MNSMIEQLNTWATQAAAVAWPILWQSSLLIALLLAADGLLGRKLRPGIRYALWLVVLVKLALPPSLASPTGLAWWVRPSVHRAQPAYKATVTYGPVTAVEVSDPVAIPMQPKPVLSVAGGALCGAGAVSIALLGYLLWRWCQMSRRARRTATNVAPAWLLDLLLETQETAGVRSAVSLRVVQEPMSPALFGLFRPVLLLPESLVQHLSATELKSVLLHELIHLRRRDIWVNCAQALLQIVYWWHPLVWLANARVRRAREEAVDEAVMLALRGEAETYAPTLLQVARLGLARPMASLGLVGILESHSALRQRIDRLVNFRPPRRAGVTLASVLCGLAFGAVALPMGQAPAHDADTQDTTGAGQTPNAVIVPTASDTKVLIQDGKLLFEMGKLDEAEKKFKAALRQNPREQAGYYYLELIRETRAKGDGRPVNVTPGRQRIYKKLDQIQLDFVVFNNAPLREVVRTLATETKRGDSDGTGIDFIIAQPSSSEKAAELPDPGDVTVWIQPALTKLRLADALDAIVKTASKPIKYSIQDYGVVFSSRDPHETLYTRIIKVDSKALENALRSAMNQPSSGLNQDVAKLLREFFLSINVDLTPPKTLFWNDREGTLFVRASLQDLDRIENAVQALTSAPAQLNIKARFIELPEAAAAAFWSTHPPAKIATPTEAQTVEITFEERQALTHAWESIRGTELLAESSVTTLSARQCSIQAQDMTNIANFGQVPVGTVLDILPKVSADALRVNLDLTASLNEFLGYSEPNGQSPPMPRIRQRSLPAKATVWDGDTLVVGGAQPAPSAGQTPTRLLVLITPTVIDPAGNRVHTDAEIERARQAREMSQHNVPAGHQP